MCTQDEELTPRQVGQWYALRAIDIDRRSRLVEHALDLVKLGLERNVPLLTEVQHQLLTLETLVYDTHQSAVTLEQLQATSQPEVRSHRGVFIIDTCFDRSSFP